MNPVTIFNAVVAWLDSPRSAPANRAANLFTAGAIAFAVCAGAYVGVPLIREAKDKLDKVVGDVAALKTAVEADNRVRDDAITRHGILLDRYGGQLHDLDKRVVRVETRQQMGVP